MVNPMNKPQKEPNKRIFSYNDKNIEIEIKFKKDYSGLTLDDRVFYLMEDVIATLEFKEDNLKDIARSYD